MAVDTKRSTREDAIILVDRAGHVRNEGLAEPNFLGLEKADLKMKRKQSQSGNLCAYQVALCDAWLRVAAQGFTSALRASLLYQGRSNG
jgi:hypothetical protein